MTEYSSAIASAKRVIAKKGDACVWRQYTVADGNNAWTENEATATFIDYPVRVVFLPYDSRTTGFTFQHVEGDVTTFTSYALMGAVAFTPRLRDTIIRSDGTMVKPMGLDMLKPGAEIVLWQIGLN